MPRRIDLGRAVLAAGSALLFVSLFLHWYDNGVGNVSGWEVFETLDLVLTALAAAGIFISVRPEAAPPWAGIGIPAAALVIVFVQLVNVPPAAAGADPASGAWLALAATLLMGAGSALSLSAISITVQVRERDVRRRVAAVDRRGATDDDLAEDLDADAGEPAPRSTSLFGSLPRRDAEAEETPRRTGRFTPRDAEGDEAAAATAHRDADATRSDSARRSDSTSAATHHDADATRSGGARRSDSTTAATHRDADATRSDSARRSDSTTAATDRDADAARGGSAASPGHGSAADLERTQPLSALPDDDEDA